MKKIILLIAFCFGAPANAADWILASSGGGLKVYLNPASFQQSGSKVQVWVRMVAEPGSKHTFAESKELWKFNCPERSQFVASWIEYAKDGSVLRSKTPLETPYDYEPIAPDTIGSDVMTAVCGS